MNPDAARDVWPERRRLYFDRLAPPDLRNGARLVAGLVAGGETVGAVVQEVLRPAQIDVGRHWQRNDWSVADEHAASAVTEAALMAASNSAPDPVREQPLVVLACASEEWHTLPLRMVLAVLTEAGFDCAFLGPSVPPDHLRTYLDSARPMALALNCTVATNLDGAAASIAAAHAAGVPVLVGGRAFGVDDHRAAVVGADAWNDDPQKAAGILLSWAGGSPPSDLGTSTQDDTESPASGGELVEARRAVMATLHREFPVLSRYDDRQLARTHEDIEHIIHFGVAAVRCRDDRIFADFAVWLRDLLTARHVPAAVVTTSLLAVADALEVSRPRVARCIRESASDAVTGADFRTV